jgi:hypothetical protein
MEANRRNALRSTGPTSSEGKQRSRCNAVRHDLTAETVIGALEDAEDYKAFEAAITADYDAQSAVERELVLRLASLLWRLRRATTMETGLFDIQAEHLREFETARRVHSEDGNVVWTALRNANPPDRIGDGGATTSFGPQTSNPGAELARCFLRLANLPTYPLDRLSRYEATLWRQAGQILFALETLDRRKPHARARGGRRRLRLNDGEED